MEIFWNKDISATWDGIYGPTALGKRTRAVGGAAIAIGTWIIDTANGLVGSTLGTWLNMGGVFLLATGNWAFASIQKATSSSRNLAMWSNRASLPVREIAYQSILFSRTLPNLR